MIRGAFVVVAAAIVAGCLLMLACSRRSEDPIAQSSARLIAPQNDAGVGATSSGKFKQEPSGAFPTLRSLVVGFNPPGGPGGSLSGWAVSNDFGLSFDRECDFTGKDLSDGGGLLCTSVPIPVNSHIPTGADGGERWNWGGDPTVVADGLGNLAYVGLGNGTTFVFVSVSQNAGASFDSTVIANDVGCGNGVQDQPNAIFDVSTSPPTLWVVWRHSGIGGPASSGACIRRGIVVKTPTDAGTVASIQWLDDPRTVQGLGGAYQYGLVVAAGDGLVTVAYAASNTSLPGVPIGCFSCCPDNGGLFSVDYGTVDSFDNGFNWTDNAKVFEATAYQWCVIGGDAGTPGQGSVLAGLRPFGLVRASGGLEYFVLQDSRHTMRLFMSPAAGVKGTTQSPTTSTIRTWFEWCPGTTTSDAGGGPKSNWKSTGIGAPTPSCGVSSSRASPWTVVATSPSPTWSRSRRAFPRV